MATDDKQRSLGELQDELKAKDRRIEELRSEIDEQRDLIQRMTEEIEDGDNVIDRWAEAFDMQQDDEGKWGWGEFVREATVARLELEDLRKEYNALVLKHNDLTQKLNSKMQDGQPVGRPLAASQAQIEQVLQLRNGGMSLRGIADETSLGLNTVRTIVDKKNRAGRYARRTHTLLNQMRASGGEKGWQFEVDKIERTSEDRQKAIKFNRQKRAIDALPKQAQRVVEEGRALIKEATGLGRS